tara:strand:- start:4986 stop:5945 length:960 start_codon:yes stop_codon:yes gene_type:complete
MINTGMRVSECIGLRWIDVDWEGSLHIRGIVTVDSGYVLGRAKTADSLRVVPMNNWVRKAIRTWHENGPSAEEVLSYFTKESGYRKRKPGLPREVVTNPRPLCVGTYFLFSKALDENSPLAYDTVYRRLKRLKKRCGLPPKGGWHEFRHAFISWAMAQKFDTKKIQLAVGHTDMKTTLRYTHLVVDDSGWVEGVYGNQMGISHNDIEDGVGVTEDFRDQIEASIEVENSLQRLSGSGYSTNKPIVTSNSRDPTKSTPDRTPARTPTRTKSTQDLHTTAFPSKIRKLTKHTRKRFTWTTLGVTEVTEIRVIPNVVGDIGI